MEKNILEAFQHNIMERLGKFTGGMMVTGRQLREKEAAERLKETLTEEQMAMVEQYHIAISATMGICELLAYKQGMKDMVSILK